MAAVCACELDRSVLEGGETVCPCCKQKVYVPHEHPVNVGKRCLMCGRTFWDYYLLGDEKGCPNCESLKIRCVKCGHKFSEFGIGCPNCDLMAAETPGTQKEGEEFPVWLL